MFHGLCVMFCSPFAPPFCAHVAHVSAASLPSWSGCPFTFTQRIAVLLSGAACIKLDQLDAAFANGDEEAQKKYEITGVTEKDVNDKINTNNARLTRNKDKMMSIVMESMVTPGIRRLMPGVSRTRHSRLDW